MRFYVSPLVIVAVCLLGCGTGNVPVSGKVTYEDGTPFTQGGTIQFLTGTGYESFMLRTPVSFDGTYNTGTKGGLPPGSYQVRVRASLPDADGPDLAGIDPDDAAAVNKATAAFKPAPPPKPEIEAKFMEFETSGLTVVIDPSVTTFDAKIGAKP